MMRSITSVLLSLAQKLAAGLNQNKPPLRTVAMTINFSKALDTLNNTKSVEALRATGLHHKHHPLVVSVSDG